jgi:hypothetical protein
VEIEDKVSVVFVVAEVVVTSVVGGAEVVEVPELLRLLEIVKSVVVVPDEDAAVLDSVFS